MAKQNKVLLKAITKTDWGSKGTESERFAALDAILQVEVTDDNGFRKAIEDNLPFWKLIKPSLPDAPVDDKYLVLPDPIDCKRIKQAAAQKRVMLGLKSDSEADKDILLNMLHYNTEECRAYLAEKVVATLKDVPGWKPNTPAVPPKPETNDSQDVLTDEAIKQIKQQAAYLYLVSQIEKAKSESLDLLVSLEAATSEDAFNKEAFALGFPNDPETTKALADVFQNQHARIKAAAKARITQLHEATASSALKTKIDDLLVETDWFSKNEDLLKTTGGKDFLDKLLQLPELKEGTDALTRADEALKEELGKQISKQLCERYVEIKLSGIDAAKDKVAAVINAKDEGELADALKGAGIDTAVVDNAKIETANINSFKIIFLKNALNKMDLANAEMLSKASNIADLKAKLAPLFGSPVTSLDFLEQKDFEGLKQLIGNRFAAANQAARTEKLEKFLDANTLLGHKAHSALIDALKTLTPDQQAKINKKNLPFILNTQNKDVLQHYLGKGIDKALLGPIVAENQKNMLLKEIHNPEIAKVLAGFTNDISLNKGVVNKINEFLIAHKDDDFSSDTQRYKALIDKIGTLCEVKPAMKEEFYKAFNLQDSTHDVLTADHAVIDALAQQHEHNKDLFAKLGTLSPAHQHLVGVILRYKSSEDVAAKLDSVLEKFDKSSSVTVFLDAIKASPIGLVGLEEQLRKDFTASEFRTIQKEHRADVFANADNAPIARAIDQLNAQLVTLEKTTATLLKQAESLSIIKDVSDLYLPDFKGKSQKEINAVRKQYEDCDTDCLSVIDHLARSARELKSQVLPVPATLTDPPASAADVKERNRLIAEAGKFNKALNVQEKLIIKEIDKYIAIHEKISKNILPAIEGEVRRLFKAEGVKIYRMNRKDAVSMNKTVADDNDQRVLSKGESRKFVGVVADGTKPDPLFSRTGKPDTNEVICFDTTRTLSATRQGQPVSIDLKGRFTYDDSPEVSTVKQESDGKKRNPGKYEIVKFPSHPGVPDNNPALEAERVRFAMIMATQILANMQKPPSKDNPIRLLGVAEKDVELRYLWTALVILGEKHPTMKFKADALEVSGGGFNPAAEKKFLGTVFKGDSLHETVFKSNSTVVDDCVKQIKEQSALQQSGAKVDIKMQKAMKDGIKEVREQIKDVAAKQEEEGLTPTAARVHNS